MADDRLHDQAGQRRGDPQHRDLFHRGAERLEDAADVGGLQREAELDAEKSETHVPDLPERQFGFAIHGGASAESGAMWRAPVLASFNGPSLPPAPPV